MPDRSDLAPEIVAASVAMLDRLPEPALLVEGGADPADRRVLFSNAAAGELLRAPAAGSQLSNAIRQPEVIDAVDEALGGKLEVEVAYETTGAQPRFWRAFARAMPKGPDGAARALLLLRDETDARRTERMRADFLANASHELRTPLAALSGFIETLRGHAKDDPQARDRFLGVMASQADRMTRLISDLLSLSRIEMNEHIAPAGKVDIAAALNDVLSASGPLWSEQKVKVEVEAPAQRLSARGDRDQLLQVLTNLLDNARRYSEAGGTVRVEISAGDLDAAQAASRQGAARLSLVTPDRDGAGPFVLVRIVDAGVGIPRQHLSRLSERFYRVEDQPGRERTGTGLGLAIVKHIVNRHRGGLTVESAEGEGTTFTVYLPRAV